MSNVQLQLPTTGAIITRPADDVERYKMAGWVEIGGKEPKPHRGAPKPDIAAGREALGKVVTTADKKSSSAKTPAGPAKSETKAEKAD